MGARLAPSAPPAKARPCTRVWPRCERGEQNPGAAIGYAAVAAEGVERGPDIGMTELGDMVVYDLIYGRRRHYLAVSTKWLRAVDARHPGRASCRACHNRSREGQPNPHNIVQRSWRLGG